MKNDTLETLFQRFRAENDVQALATVFDRTAPHLHTLARRLGGDSADDLLQDTYLSSMEKADAWDNSRPLMPWLLGILAHRARRNWDDKRRQPDPHRLPERHVELPDASPMAREFQMEFTHALQGLTPALRQAVEASLVDGQSPTQLAVNLGLRAGTVRQRLSRGLSELRTTLKGAILALVGFFGFRESGLAAVRSHVLMSASVTGSVPAIGGAAYGFRLTLAGVLAACTIIGILVGLYSTDRGGSLGLQEQLALNAPAGLGAGTEEAALHTIEPANAREALAIVKDFKILLLWKSSGDPVVGRTVQLKLKNKERQVSDSDAEGFATFTLSVGQVPSSATALATATSPRVHKFMTPAVLAETPTLHIGEGGSLSGVVLDPQGTPVPNATVEGWMGSGHDRTADRTTLANAKGEFTLEHLGAEFIVTARKSDRWVGYQGLRGSLLDGDRLTGHELTVAALGSMAGRIMHPDGKPAAGVELRIEHATSHSGDTDITHDHQVSRFLAGQGKCTSDHDGRFLIAGLPPRGHSITAKLAPYLIYSGYHALLPDQVEARFEAGHSLTGSVTDSNGKAVEGAEVAFWPFWSNVHTTPFWNTCQPSDGSFVLNGLSKPEGAQNDFRRLIIVRAPGYAIQVLDELPADLDSINPLSIQLLPGRVLEGTVLQEDGTPAASIAVRIEGDRVLHDLGYSNGTPHTWEKKARCDEVRTDANGHFHFGELYPGMFKIQVFADEVRQFYLTQNARSGQGPLSFRFTEAALKKVVIRPIVQDAITGEAIEGFKFRHWREEGGRLHSLTPGPNGLEAAGLDPGYFGTSISAEGYVDNRHEDKHYSVGVHDALFTLYPYRSLRMDCKWGNGEPIDFFWVKGSGPDGTAIQFTVSPYSSTRKINVHSANGSIHGLPAGQVQLTIGRGDATAEVTLDLTEAREQPLEVILTPVIRAQEARETFFIMQRRAMAEGSEEDNHNGYLYCPEHPFTLVVTRPAGQPPVRIEYKPSRPRPSLGEVVALRVGGDKKLADGEPATKATTLGMTLSVQWGKGGSFFEPKTAANPLVARFKTELGPCSVQLESDHYELLHYSWTAKEGSKHTLKLIPIKP
ncbi:MAG: sigma-70 family RNA polymerase sigma factor [bacterium]|nr:sigma-70 family RNA polymerase sigma factor [bacterium]